MRIAYDAGKPAAATRATFAALAADPAPPGTAQWVANHFGNSDVQIKADHGAQRSADALANMWSATARQVARPRRCGPGSTNFTDDAWTLQENNIITISSPALAAAYRSDFEDLWAAGSIKRTGLGDSGTTRPRA